MSPLYLAPGIYPVDILRPTSEYILSVQCADGSIPWFAGGHTDPWDHIESAMGLTVASEYDAARRAYAWLRETQLADGSWWTSYRDGLEIDTTRRETNFVAYVATGVWHYFLATDDLQFVQSMWDCVARAIDFVVRQQGPIGDINWAVDEHGRSMEDALVTGCSSIFKSLDCALALASTLELSRPDWRVARDRLGDALRYHPQRFDRTWESKARYSMDWFYPVLTGAIVGKQARARLRQRWSQFVVDGLGCRCVSDEPWVTVAETCELVLALLKTGDRARAAELFSWMYQWRDEDGAYWTGYQWVEAILWPYEKPTWTAAALLLAADGLTGHSGASKLFTAPSGALDDAAHQAEALNARQHRK